MSRKEKIQAIIGIIATIVVLVIVGRLVSVNDRLPRLVFWLMAEIFAMLDGYTVYNLVRRV